MTESTGPEFKNRFTTTRWSVVCKAQDSDDEDGALALEQLCKTYWQPLYSYVRSKVSSPQQAADLTQGFFAHLIEKRILTKVAPERGNFRSFLLACIRNFMNNEFDRENAVKRGGGVARMSLDLADAESGFAMVSREPSPESAFDKQWASSLIARVHSRLEESSNSNRSNRTELDGCLQEFLTKQIDDAGYEMLNERFGLSKVAARVAIHRLRERFRKLIRQEVADTLEADDSIDQEISYLLSVLGK